MNKLTKGLCDVLPGVSLNMSTDKFLKDKPKGIHPFKKNTYRHECAMRYHSYESYIEKMRDRRLIGNRKPSHFTTKRMKMLKKEAGIYGNKK
jgi:hypothetical protein